MAEELRHDSWDYRSARSSVGMPFVTLCVTSLRRTANARPDAERQNGIPTRSMGTMVFLRALIALRRGASAR